jgi:hypothetical protein
MMTAILRAALVAAFTAAAIPTVAAGQTVSTDSLLRRIAALERRVGELEARVRVEPSRAVPASLASWRRLRRGMKMDDVRELLGEPVSVEAVVFIYWHYADGAQVVFGTDDKVQGWTEPPR